MRNPPSMVGECLSIASWREMVHTIVCPVAYLHHPVECEDESPPQIHICFGATQRHLDQPKLYRKIT